MKKVLGGSLLACAAAWGHHGVPSISLTGVDGPGAPLETTSSSTLPEGSFLGYLKLDHAKYKTYTSARDGEMDRTDYWLYGLGYGATPYLSAYVFMPYYTKALDDSTMVSGFHDVNFQVVLGLVYDEGFKLARKNESLDDMEDWHFTIFANGTLPTGNSERKDAGGVLIDPGMQTGFGEPSLMVGASMTKWFGNAFTFVGDCSYNTFFEHTYDDGTKLRFGDEIRVNGAVTARVYEVPKSRLRVDASLEANYLYLGRDEEDGVGAEATGGSILYTTPSLRVTYKTISAAMGVKLPTATDLNEDDLQQGAEGKEHYRFIFTFSTLF
ncbi:transporter [Sulfurimonas sp. HSL1-6]|uniref:transporter n=1 Tax=Thiomicrolovo immobilis TaxID=3131935 RepID=UPI0031F82C08